LYQPNPTTVRLKTRVFWSDIKNARLDFIQFSAHFDQPYQKLS